jgi:hypothetical protein
MILKKARRLMKAGNRKAALAKTLIETSQNLDSARTSPKVLQPSEYRVRAEAMVAARRLVGGVEIEVVHDMKAGKKK